MHEDEQAILFDVHDADGLAEDLDVVCAFFVGWFALFDHLRGQPHGFDSGKLILVGEAFGFPLAHLHQLRQPIQQQRDYLFECVGAGHDGQFVESMRWDLRSVRDFFTE